MHPTYSFHSETNYDLTIVYWVHEYHDRCLIRNRKWLFFTLWLSFDFIGGWAGSCISFKLRVFLVFCYLFFVVFLLLFFVLCFCLFFLSFIFFFLLSFCFSCAHCIPMSPNYPFWIVIFIFFQYLLNEMRLFHYYSNLYNIYICPSDLRLSFI
jgi:hypothetical protein